ncbi:MAG: Mur ligase family protein [Bacilli bacterium]
MNKFFMIGINGVGMSALACILKNLGNEVVGSDVDAKFFTQEFLDELAIEKYLFNEFDFDENYIVIAGNSFAKEFPEISKAFTQGNKVYYYYEFLGEMSKSTPSIAISGTHGKTTTTTMLRDILSINHDISYLIGDGHGRGVANAKYFVFEACEYKNHFHSYFPKYAIITNVGYDHLDFFPTKGEYEESFVEFVNNVQDKVIVCGDDTDAYRIFKNNSNVIFYGTEDYCKIQAKNIDYVDSGSKFDIYIDNKFICNFNTETYGKHNILNLLGCLAIAYLEGENIEEICNLYNGKIHPKRRFEEYIYEEQIIIDDNAHHPSEVKSFLDSVFQKYPNKKVLAILEPHTVDRLLEYKSRFAKELNRCDEQLILPVKIPLRDEKKYANGHAESDIMLDDLDHGMFYDENSYDYLLTKENWIVLFMGITISSYTRAYIERCNLHFTSK